MSNDHHPQPDLIPTKPTKLHPIQSNPQITNHNSSSNPNHLSLQFNQPHSSFSDPIINYKLYKRRYLNLIILSLLNLVSSLQSILFTTISSVISQYFRISLSKVNWLSNLFGVSFVILAWFVPYLIDRFSIRWVCILAGLFMTMGTWLRYLAVWVPIHSSNYALLLLGSLLISVSQPLLLVIGPALSELHFPPQARLTATMIVAISNPMGQALGDLIVPLLVSDQIKSDEIKTLLLIVGSGTSLVSLSALMISHRPPSPPSALSQLSRQSPFTGFRILFGFRPPSSLSSSKFVSRDQKLQPAYEMNLCRSSLHQINPTLPSESPCTISGPGLDHLPLGSLSQRDRLDFLILTLLFGTLVGSFTTYTLLIEQIYSRYFAATTIFSGLLSAGISSPILDRFMKSNHRTSIIKSLGPMIGISYFLLIFFIKPNSISIIYLLNVCIGVFSFICLPISLELGADLTYTIMTPDSSAAILYITGNAFSVIFLLIEDALRHGPEALPPFDMKRSIIFQGIITLLASASSLALHAQQRRPDH